MGIINFMWKREKYRKTRKQSSMSKTARILILIKKSANNPDNNNINNKSIGNKTHEQKM